jgi:hypothetical protein
LKSFGAPIHGSIQQPVLRHSVFNLQLLYSIFVVDLHAVFLHTQHPPDSFDVLHCEWESVHGLEPQSEQLKEQHPLAAYDDTIQSK